MFFFPSPRIMDHPLPINSQDLYSLPDLAAKYNLEVFRRSFHVDLAAQQDLLANAFISRPAASSTRKGEGDYPVVDPDIKDNSKSDDFFRMYHFKVQPCSRVYVHDWTACPCAHPGETARRRDPMKYRYSCLPCPLFQNGAACPRGDLCKYAHGIFERWLHPAKYRTLLCRNGARCPRRVCFFAHAIDELRQLASSPALLPLQSSPLHGTELNVPGLHLNPALDIDLSSLAGGNGICNNNGRNLFVGELALLSEQYRQSLLMAAAINANGKYPITINHDQQQRVPKFPSILQASVVWITEPNNSHLGSLFAALTLEQNPQQRHSDPRAQDLHPKSNSSWTNKWPIVPTENGDGLGRSMSFELATGGEVPDISWVKSMVGPPDAKMEHEMRSSAST